MKDPFEHIGSLTKRRGFIYPGSELYGGLAGTWDYGPLGALLKKNIKDAFWKQMVQERSDVVGLDAAILMNPRVWEASGHVESFSDPLVECKKCHTRFRADELGWDISKKPTGGITSTRIPPLGKKCPNPKCDEEQSNFIPPRMFNLLVDANLGVIEGEKQKVYLRGEITQGVHVNFKNVLGSTRVKLPFGIAQIGKAFRNEITPGNLTFRSREFEQMELQFFIKPDETEAERWIEYWKKERLDWYVRLGLDKKKLRIREHESDERAHYARAAFDIEYKIPNGEWKELEGIHNRGDWDLKRHQEFSGEDLTYFDEETKERILPWVIETSGGVDRAALFFITDAYREEEVKDESRTLLSFTPTLAPYKIAVFPLLANKQALIERAESIYKDLRKEWMVAWDDRGNIGKRYRSQDEAGTPYCVTVDFDSIDSEDVTVRNRDTMDQERVKIVDLKSYFSKKLA